MTARRGRQRPEDLALLREVLLAHAPNLLEELLGKARSDSLARTERNQLCQWIGAELIATGLRDDSEPNERGIKLEDLLDWINRPNWNL